MAFPGMLELTEEQTQQLVNIIEEKQSCVCEVANSMHTVWITSADGENELLSLDALRWSFLAWALRTSGVVR